MLQRLTQRLKSSFDGPPIVCHHDSHQVRLDTTIFGDNVRFVPNPIRTRWGDLSLVRAFRLALHQLYNWKPTDWFVLLSASDYPIKPPDVILAELRNSSFDAYLDHHHIPDYGQLPPPYDRDFEQGTRRPYWLRIAYDRYIAKNFRYPGFNRKGKLCLRWLRFGHPRFLGPSPFSSTYRCYGGDAWITGRARCAELMFSDGGRWPELLEYYRKRQIPDESMFHTILCNTPGLKFCSDNKRYADWTAGRPSPKWLGMDDLPALLHSSHHFARKFSASHDSRVLDELDRVIERAPSWSD